MTSDAPRKRSPLALLYATLGAVALAGGGVLFWQLDTLSSRPPKLEAVSIPAQALDRARGMESGDPRAPVTLVEFGDFECRPCGHFARSVMPKIRAEYVNTGRVRYVFHDFPITANHANAVAAAVAARCANDQGRFTEYHDLLFEEQSAWAAERDPSARFESLAPRAGLNRAAFARCLRSSSHGDRVRESQELGTELGVRGTPTIFLNGKRLADPPNVRQLRALIDAELASASRSAGR